MEIRRYEPSDCQYLAELFYQTVHCVNAKDYTETQLNAWADGSVDLAEWNKSFSGHNTICTNRTWYYGHPAVSCLEYGQIVP